MKNSRQYCKYNDVIPGIYKITCLINDKFYIGQSMNVYSRIRSHFGHPTNLELKEDMEKYGKDNFKWELIQTFKVSDYNNYNNVKRILKERETFYIRETNALTKGYNRTDNFYHKGINEIDKLLEIKSHFSYMFPMTPKEFLIYKLKNKTDLN